MTTEVDKLAHAREQAKAQAEGIAAMVAALHVDYARFVEQSTLLEYCQQFYFGE